LSLFLSTFSVENVDSIICYIICKELDSLWKN
jgi:hypothetical protein